MQKVLYFAHMRYLGIEKKRLIDEDFQAWEYGPVLPSLYHRVKVAGRNPVHKVLFLWEDPELEEDSIEYRYLKDTYEAMKDIEPGQMINISHCEGGAWDEVYEMGTRNIIIPEEAIIKEFHARNKYTA